MGARAWVSGVNSQQADEPNKWSPTGVPQPGENLTWGSSQSVSVRGASTRGVIATLCVDDLLSFPTSTTPGFGEIVIGGLSADSYSIKHDLLLLCSGAKVVERLNLAVSTDARGFQFS